MRKLTIASVLAIALTTLAIAGSPHFLRFSAAANGSGVEVSFKEAGLGNNQVIHYLATANATATWVCINGGRKNPSASNKQEVSGLVSAEGDFSSGKNGSISGSLDLGAPDSSLSCPNGQHLELACASYTNITLQDTTNSVSAGTISGPITFSDPIWGQFCGN
jgi:hypothetical protein